MEGSVDGSDALTQVWAHLSKGQVLAIRQLGQILFPINDLNRTIGHLNFANVARVEPPNSIVALRECLLRFFLKFVVSLEIQKRCPLASQLIEQ